MIPPMTAPIITRRSDDGATVSREYAETSICSLLSFGDRFVDDESDAHLLASPRSRSLPRPGWPDEKPPLVCTPEPIPPPSPSVRGATRPATTRGTGLGPVIGSRSSLYRAPAARYPWFGSGAGEPGGPSPERRRPGRPRR